jgi:opacity protein-like surface antigen
MHRRIGWLVAALTLVLAASASAATAKRIEVTVGGGLTIPTGDFGDGAKSGWNLSGSVDYPVSEMIAVGVHTTWHNNEHQDVGTTTTIAPGVTETLDEDKFSIVDIGAHAKLRFAAQDASITPYALIGVGMYQVHEAYTYTIDDGVTRQTFTEKDDEQAGFFEQIGSRFGARVGLGATFKASEQIGIDVAGEYNFVSLDKNKSGSSNFQFGAIRAGIVWGFPI